MLKFIYLTILATIFTSCDRPKNPPVNVSCTEAGEKEGKCTMQKGLPDPSQPPGGGAGDGSPKPGDGNPTAEADALRSRCQASPSTPGCEAYTGTSEACRQNPNSVECLNTSGITDSAGYQRCITDGTSTASDCLRQFGGGGIGGSSYQQCLETSDEYTCRQRFGSGYVGIGGSSYQQCIAVEDEYTCRERFRYGGSSGLSECLSQAYSESTRQDCYNNYSGGSGWGGTDNYQYRQCIASDDSYSNRERCRRLYGEGSEFGSTELDRRCRMSEYEDTYQCREYLRRMQIACEEEARGVSSSYSGFDCSDFASSGERTSRSSLSSDHGRRYLLVRVAKDDSGRYVLFIDSIDQSVRNIRIAYVTGTAFSGKKGPVIRAKVQWEYDSRTCVGKATTFSLKDYSESKKLLTDCGV